MKRFWSKVDKKGDNDCWNWKAGKMGGIYGLFYFNREKQGAHRVSWQLHYGNIPKGMWVLHKCDNPPCVNPQHLFLGTAKDNHIDMVNKGRSTKGEKNPSAKMTEDKVRAMRNYYSMYKPKYRELANMFNISSATAWQIINKKLWLLS